MSSDRLKIEEIPGADGWYLYNVSREQPGRDIEHTLGPLAFESEKLPEPGTALIDAEPFRLVVVEPSGSPKTGRLEVSKSIWAFDGPGIRPPVRTAFDTMLSKLEALEGNGVVPGASGLLRQIIATVVPSTFEESLYFNYSLFRRATDGARAYVDLQAAMRLGIDFQFSQFVAPPDVDGNAGAFNPLVNGYVGAAQSHIHLSEAPAADGKPRLAFNAFIAGAPLPEVKASQGGAAGVIDLRNPAFRRRYFRLCLPAQFLSSDGPGAVGTAFNFTLIGADNRLALEKATDAYYLSEPIGPDAVSVFFRGRVVITPEIQVFFNGMPLYLPVGTTIRQFLQRYFNVPRLPDLDLAQNSAFQYSRYQPSADFGSGAFPDYYNKIDFSKAKDVLTADAYDLPVLAADALKLRGI